MKGFLLHYDGSAWKEIVKGDSGNLYQFVEVKGENGDVFVQEYRGSEISDDSDVTNIYKLGGNHLDKIYSFIGYSINNQMEFVGEEVYFPFGTDAYTYSNGTFIKQFSVNNTNWIQHLSGRNPGDIFLNMWDGVAHFNGTDIQYIYRWPLGITYFTMRATIFNQDIFFLLNRGYTNLVLHGKLKQ